MREFIFCLFFINAFFNSFAQNFSNKGQDFWVSYPAHVDATNSAMGIYITSDVNATGQLNVAGTIVPFTVAANTVTYKFIGPGASGSASNIAPYLDQQDGIKIGAGIHVTADRDVAVYAHIIKSARSGATLVLPVKVWGKEYMLPSYRHNGTTGYGELVIMAALPNTTVEITPAVDTRSGRPANVPYQITLANPGDAYQVQFVTSLDLSGTRVKSLPSNGIGCLPIAVFSATTFTSLGCPTALSGDNLLQQIFPIGAWGKQFLTSPLKKVPSNAGDGNVDIIRVFVNDPTTVVTKIENGITVTLSGLISSSYYEYTTYQPTFINADKPIQVVQYTTTQSCGSPQTVSDPEMIVLNAVEQTINDITVFSAHQNFVPPGQSQVTNHFLNIIMKTVNTPVFKINGVAPAAAFIPIPGTAYSYLKEDISIRAATNPVSRLTADSGFSAIAYGFGNVESYGYNAGTNIKDLYQQIGVVNQYGTETTPSVCSNSPFKFKVSLPYIPDSLRWDFNNANGMMPNNNPVFINNAGNISKDSTTVVNGKTIYWYSLPTLYNFTTAGIYPVKITTYVPNNDCGTLQIINFDLSVSNPPVANFSFSGSGCVAEFFQFTETTPQLPKPTYNWWWNFGDAASGASNIATSRNPTHLFSSPGTYLVKFVSITTPGCFTDTLTKTVIVQPLPSATVSGATIVCINAAQPTITFAASGGTAPYTFTYNINGGAPLTIASAGVSNTATVIVPTAIAGSFIYTLQSVKNSGSSLCTKTILNQNATVLVNPDHVITLSSGITTTSQIVCINSPIVNITYALGGSATGANVTGLPAGVSTSVSGNTLTISGSPTTTLGSPFSYSIITTGSSCVTASANGILTVKPDHTINLSSAAATISQSTCMNKAIIPITYILGGGATGATVTGLPAGLTSSVAGNILTISGAPSIAVGSSFNFTIITTGNNCISASAVGSIIVFKLPTVNFNNSTPACETGIINFTDASVSNSGSINSWSWNFADVASGINNVSALQNPTHVFSTYGNYTVTLNVTNTPGCSNALPFTKNVFINPLPKAGYIIPDVCLSDTYAQFIDTSKIPMGNIAAWAWNFGDPVSGVNNTSTLQLPQHSYRAVGSYPVELIVTSNSGCKDTILKSLFVNGSFPVAAFILNNSTSLCANDSVSIAEASTVFPGSITKIEIYWDNLGQPTVFDTDDNPFTGKVYKHLYSNFQLPLVKNFTIRYRAYSGGICVNDRLQIISVNAAPKVIFNIMQDVCLDAVPFQITQASETGRVPGTAFYSGIGVTSSGIFSPAIAGPGTHTIQYKFIAAAGGCADSISQTIKVLQPAIAKFSVAAPLCETKAITFNQSSTSTAGSITKWTWNFGDGSPLFVGNNGNPVTHTYLNWGTYSVKLNVTTNSGCVSKDSVLVIFIKPQPQPNFAIPESVCFPNALAAFSNQSGIADGTGALLSYSWNFGDPASGTLNNNTGVNPSHIYSTAGPFNVTLQVTSNAGCIHDTTIVLNTIHAQPLSSFTVNKNEACLSTGGAVQFTDNSNGMGGVTNEWNWDLRDGSLRNVSAFAYTYSTAGTYNVSLSTVNSFGCLSTTFTLPITIHPLPEVNAGPDKLVLEDGQVTLESVVKANEPLYLWTPNLYFISSNTIALPVVKGVDDITYTLKVTSRGGCEASDDVFVKVLKNPAVPNTFSPNGDGINEKWIIEYLDTYPNCRVQVFTRNGKLVFESKGYKTPWNGTMNNKTLPIDTYYYIIEPGNGRKPVTGFVTIVK